MVLSSGWGVVQLVGHLTVNEDGVGSSPTAPAKLIVVEKSSHRMLRCSVPKTPGVKTPDFLDPFRHD